MQYRERVIDPEVARRVHEALAEGLVEANRAIIDDDPDAFPCCCGCGEFKLVSKRAVPRVSIGEVQGPKALTASALGNAFELACFQCAQRRREGDEGAYVQVDVDDAGMLQCVVVRTEGDDENMTKYAPKSEPVQRNCPGGEGGGPCE